MALHPFFISFLFSEESYFTSDIIAGRSGSELETSCFEFYYLFSSKCHQIDVVVQKRQASLESPALSFQQPLPCRLFLLAIESDIWPPSFFTTASTIDAIDNKAAARIHHRGYRNSGSRTCCAHAETNLQGMQAFISLVAALHNKPNACSPSRQGRAGNTHRH